MSNETSGVGLEAHFSSTPITYDELEKRVDTLDRNIFFPIDAFPDKEQAQMLAQLPVEIMVVTGKDGRTHIVIGEEDTVTALNEVLEALEPEIVGHTHPKEDIPEPNRRMFSQSIPSASDLTSRRKHATTEYIFNEFGRTTYTAIKDRGVNPNSNVSYYQQIINNAMSSGAKEAREKGIADVKEAINYIGKYMKIVGCEFKFEVWDEVEM